VNAKGSVEDAPSGKITMGNGETRAIMDRSRNEFSQKPFNLQGLSLAYSIRPEQ